jgi:dipeptidyl aminopeptidase/acylaminoacyl peptidase
MLASLPGPPAFGEPAGGPTEPAAAGIVAGSTRPVRLTKPYARLDDSARYNVSADFYERARTQSAFECVRFLYPSGDTQVTGFLYRPVRPGARRYPLVVYNRGGTGNFGRIGDVDIAIFHALAERGFVAIASDYRFVDAAGPRDELGGIDVEDVLNLIPIGRSLPFVAPDALFMLGISRGGQMTYQALRRVRVNAAAVIAGATDIARHAANRPEFLEGWNDSPSPADNYLGLANVLPDFAARRDSYMRERSAVAFAEELTSPILILHSRQDGRVSADQALALALRLQALGKPYSLKIYDPKSHGLPAHRFDSYDEITAWFQQHRAKPVTPSSGHTSVRGALRRTATTRLGRSSQG